MEAVEATAHADALVRQTLDYLGRRIRVQQVVASPVMVGGQSFKNYLPNNDLDAVGADARRIGDIRTWKPIRPRVFDASVACLYAWAFDHDEESEHHALSICALAERLYQFGRGVDMAWAWGEVIDHEELEALLSSYPGAVYRPSQGGSGRALACPEPGSLTSLRARYAANSRRFKTEGRGKNAMHAFSQQRMAACGGVLSAEKMMNRIEFLWDRLPHRPRPLRPLRPRAVQAGER